MGHCVGNETWKSAAPTDSYFAFSVSLHWSSISSICRFDGALSTSAANGLLSSSNLLFGGFKIGKLPYEVSTKYAEFFSKLSSWVNGSSDLLFHCLAVREMAQVFLKNLRLPQAQLGFKSPHCSVHVSDYTAPPLKLQV